MSYLSLDLIENHSSALRRLAVQLVGDVHEAEDAVQETWLQALRFPPASLDRFRQWAETVLRNVVRRRYGQRVRSREYEILAAKSVAVDSTIDIVLKRRVLAALTAAILELDSELQECVFLRYFEGEPPRRIALRVGRSVTVVYRQLERAKRELRCKLGEEEQSWRLGLSALIGLKSPRSLLIVGGLIVTKKVLVVLGSVLLIVAALVGNLIWTPGSLVPTASPVPMDMQARSEALENRAPVFGEERNRIELGQASDALEALAPYLFSLAIWARDTDDFPAANVSIWIGPAQHALNEAKTDEDGVLRVQWRGRSPSATMYLASPQDVSEGRRLRRIVVDSGEEAAASIRVRSSSSVTFRLAPSGEFERDTRPAQDVAFFYQREFDGWNARAVPRKLQELHVDAEGFAWFTTSVGAERYLSEPQWLPSLSVRSLQAAVGNVLASEVANAKERIIRGIVRDHLGQPVAEALVESGNTRAETNRDGEFALKRTVANGGSIQLRAGGGNHGLASTEILVREESQLVWDAVLDRGIEFTGNLVDGDGKALAKWRIEIQPEDGPPWIDGTETDANGFFAIPNVERRAYELRAFPPKSIVPVFQKGVLMAGTPHRLTVLEVPDRGRMGFDVRTPNLDGNLRGEFRLWLDGVDEGILLFAPIKPQEMLIGLYEIEFGAVGLPWMDLSSAQVFEGETAEFRETLTAGSSSLDLESAREFALYWMHDAVPSRVEIEGKKRIALPAGTYRAIGSGVDVEFEVVEGENALPVDLIR